MKNSIRILYLEDDELDRRTFARYTDKNRLPYETEYASKLSDAEQILKTKKFDVIVADYKLPDGTGLDLVKSRPTSPIIMLTAYGEQMVTVRATTLGVSDYVVKETGEKHLDTLAQSIDWVTKVRSNPIQLKKEIKILIIEDNMLDQRSVERVLSKNPSYQYLFASTLKQATELLKNEIFDLAIVDASLPDGTTAETFSYLNEIPFIVISGASSEEYIALAYQCGASDYLLKDVNRFYLKLLPTSIEKTLQTFKTRETKDHFISFLSHEIRTPLTLIEAAIANIAEGTYGKLSEDQAKIFNTLQIHSKRLSRVVKDILNLSKLESGKAKMELNLVSLKEIVSKALEDCEKIKSKEIILKNLVPENLPKILVDETMIYCLFINLVSNALRFAKSQIIVKGQIVDENSIQMSVVDDGAGIPKESQEKLFNKFEQATLVEGLSNYKGTGLGLVICKQIVKLHKGNIWVESSLNHGAQFHFLLSRTLK